MTAASILRIIARGVEVGHTGRMRKFGREDLMNLARDYCDDNDLSYSRKDLQFVERAAFLNAGLNRCD